MKLPKNYFDNLSAGKYRQYLKLLPKIESENAELFVTLSLTFASLIFFGIFAINPTLTTIVDLKKKVSDAEFVQLQLHNKINSISQLEQQYNILAPDLPVIFDAIPIEPAAPILVGQIQALAKKSNLSLSNIHVYEVQLTSIASNSAAPSSFVFSLDAKGNYENMLLFVSDITNINRIITIESIAIARDTRTSTLVLSLRGREYFKK
jgi:Tfp pilus assembly protein PilO